MVSGPIPLYSVATTAGSSHLRPKKKLSHATAVVTFNAANMAGDVASLLKSLGCRSKTKIEKQSVEAPKARAATRKKLIDWNTLPNRASLTPCDTAKIRRTTNPMADDDIRRASPIGGSLWRSRVSWRPGSCSDRSWHYGLSHRRLLPP